MCGIAGWCFDRYPRLSFVVSLGFCIEDRGKDSWGYWNGDKAKLVKGVGPITGTPMSAMQFKQGFLHTRLATTGKVNKDNSHPFRCGSVVGAHNGMISNHEELNATYKRDHAVDSQHLFSHIDAGLSLSDVNGYGAVEFTQEGTYYIGAANGGELACAKLDVGVVWASTAKCIEVAVMQAGYTVEKWYEIEQGKMYSVDAKSLWCTDMKFDLGARSYFSQYCGGYTSHWRHSSGKDNWKNGWELDGFDTRYHTTEDNTTEVELEEDDLTTVELGRSWRDTCDWCGEYTDCVVMDDSSTGCLDCAQEVKEYTSKGWKLPERSKQ